MTNAARGEATMYPSFMMDFATMPVDPERICAGSSCMVGYTDCAVSWGVGKVGYEGGLKSSIVPKYLEEKITQVLSVASGEGPQLLVSDSKRSDFPEFAVVDMRGGAAGEEEEEEEEEAPKKKKPKKK
jgi:hypothetical protein